MTEYTIEQTGVTKFKARKNKVLLRLRLLQKLSETGNVPTTCEPPSAPTLPKSPTSTHSFKTFFNK